MKITEDNEFRAEIEAALCHSLESIRGAVNAGALTRGDLIHERLWIMAARAYSDAYDHIDGRGLTPVNGPLWLVQADADDPLKLGSIQEWLRAKQSHDDASFVFPEMPLSGDFAYKVFFLTDSMETATLFKLFHL